MSKKTATKKSAKKPDPKAAGERALNLRKIAMEEEAMRIRRIVSKMLEPVHKRLTALESRSAPAEEWKPKVGDILTRVSPDSPMNGKQAEAVGFSGDCVRVSTGGYWDWKAWLCRPATPAEIADYKAKEEQRAKEAELAKFDELQPGDECENDGEITKLVIDGGLWEHPYVRCSDYAFLIWRDRGMTGNPHECGHGLPKHEFLRRLRGTIAKRAEDERAKEMAKVPEFGNRVEFKDGPPFGKFDVHEARYIGRRGSVFMFAYPNPSDPNITLTIVAGRHEFTIID